jgi:hypothetical protein
MLARSTKDKEPAIADAPKHSIAFVGIDIGKNSFHVTGLDERGVIVLRQKWSRGSTTLPTIICYCNKTCTLALARNQNLLFYKSLRLPAIGIRGVRFGSKNGNRPTSGSALDIVAKVFFRHRTQILRALGATIE